MITSDWDPALGDHQKTREEVIDAAAEHYGKFLQALGFNYQHEPHMHDTPRRVAKAWYDDLARGCYQLPPKITAFPNEGKYSGMVLQKDIPVRSLCAHHNLPFIGMAHVAYIPGYDDDSLVVGLSKLNRIVEHFARRPNVQESLTVQIHDYVNETCEGNRGVAVIIESGHTCVSCRGVSHDSEMTTSQLSGYFYTNEVGTRTELFALLNRK